MTKKNAPKNRHNDCWNTIGVWSSASEKCEMLSRVVHCRNCDVFSRAGREVLERIPPGGYVTQWRNEIAKQLEKSDTGLSAIMMFRLGNEWFAISIKHLEEVAELRSIHRIPHNVNTNIIGVVNIGGEVDVCYSMGSILGVEKGEKQDGAYQRLIVTNYGNNRFIFPVSEVRGMTRYSVADIQSAPSTLGDGKSSLIYGVIKDNDKQVTILNIEKLCQHLLEVAV
jgi:chemotaxis-related protein WspD